MNYKPVIHKLGHDVTIALYSQVMLDLNFQNDLFKKIYQCITRNPVQLPSHQQHSNACKNLAYCTLRYVVKCTPAISPQKWIS